ncbi:MAG TPA: DUF932 domain-containing protein [Nevskiaceae bacterium]|nr:DUF932 domain-containing protein [Nevskiaceae bacterium]
MTRLNRLTRLDELVFDVEERAMWTEGAGSKLVRVPDRRAIVNTGNGRIVGVVGRDYRLVTHRQALEWARECCRVAFPQTRESEWEVRGVDAPATGGHCFIDLVHCTGALDFALVPGADRPEAHGPFVRVTNSYNGVRALSFDIGLHRKVCNNGLILPETLVEMRFQHRRGELPETLDFEVHRERLARATADFSALMATLRATRVRREEAVSQVIDALQFREPGEDDATETQWDDWREFELIVQMKFILYAHELGENAYALFNVITDLATRPPELPRQRRERHTLQRLAGLWLAGFRRPEVPIDTGNPPDFRALQAA